MKGFYLTHKYKLTFPNRFCLKIGNKHIFLQEFPRKYFFHIGSPFGAPSQIRYVSENKTYQGVAFSRTSSQLYDNAEIKDKY